MGLGILLAVVSAVKRSSAQREAEEAAAQDAASVITETEAAQQIRKRVRQMDGGEYYAVVTVENPYV